MARQKRTTAFWIEAVKKYGAEGMSNIRLQTVTQYALAKEAVDGLVQAGYVQTNSPPAGSDHRLKLFYTVTSFGHRYLNENRDEVDDVADPETPTVIKDEPPFVGANDVKTVPQDTPAPVLIPRPTPLVRSHPGVTTPDGVPVLPKPAIVTPQTAAAAGITPTDQLVEKIKSAASPLLFERFGDQVNLKQLVTYLEEHK